MNRIEIPAAGAAPAPSGEPVAPAAELDTTDPRFAAKATRAAVQFEGFFIAQMLHQMRASSHQLGGEDGALKSAANNDMLDLVDTMVADKMAGQRAFGIADAILRQLLPPAPAATPQKIDVTQVNSSAPLKLTSHK